MSIEWTTERLDALPKETLILAASGNPPDWMYLVLGVGEWWVVGDRGMYRTEDFVRFFDLSTIRVVSVPINALLDPAASEALVGGDPRIKRATVHAAIAHATGETDI